MQSSIEQRIIANPKYQLYVSKQRILILSCTIVMLTLYFSYILISVIAPDILATKVSDGSALPVAIVISVAIILLQVVLTFFYAYVENNIYSKLKHEIIEEAKHAHDK